MKNLLRLSLLLALIILTSCDKDPVVEPEYEARRSNLIGTWAGTTQFTGGADNTFTLAINEDGTGTRLSVFQEGSIPFEWVYQYNPEKIVLKESPIGFNLVNTIIYNITKNNPNEQTWTYDTPDVSGQNTGIITTWELERQ